MNSNERAVMAFLGETYLEEGRYYCFAPIVRETKLDRRVVRRAARSLARKGFLEFMRGLWTDEGEPRGSGYGCTASGHAFFLANGLAQDETHQPIRDEP